MEQTFIEWKILIVDDDPSRHLVFDKMYAGHKLSHVSKYYDAIAALTGSPKFDIVQLDHDLADFGEPDRITSMYDTSVELTGYDIARFIVTELPAELRPRHVIVHSLNPCGAQSIELLLKRNGISVIRMPFGYESYLAERAENILA